MFDSHKLTENGFKEMSEFKENFALAVKKAMDLMPNNRERSIFFTKIEDAVFFGAKAIASKKENFSEVITYGEGHGQTNSN